MTDTRVEKRIPNWSIKLNRAQNESCLPSQTRIGSSLSASRPHRRSSVPSSMPASLPQIMISTHMPLKMHTPINIKLSLSNLTRTLPTQKTRRFSDQLIRRSSSLYSANTRVHILLGKRGRREIKKKRGKRRDKYLSDKVADDTAVINAHARAVRVEDPGNPHLHTDTHRETRIGPPSLNSIRIILDLTEFNIWGGPVFSWYRFFLFLSNQKNKETLTKKKKTRKEMNCKSGQIYLDAGSSVVVHGQRLGSTLSLVVAASDTCLAPTTKKDPLSDLSPHLAPPAHFWSPRFNLSRPALGSQILLSLSLSLSLSSSRAQLCSTSKTLTDPPNGTSSEDRKEIASLPQCRVELQYQIHRLESEDPYDS